MRTNKNFDIKNIGQLGDSLYIRIKRGKKTELFIRVSYHKPLSALKPNRDGSDNNIKNVLCIDTLSWSDELKVHNIRLKKFTNELNDGNVKDKELHKKMFFKHIRPKFPNSKFVDLEDDDFEKVKNTIKTFLEENGFSILENLNRTDYSVEYELINEYWR